MSTEMDRGQNFEGAIKSRSSSYLLYVDMELGLETRQIFVVLELFLKEMGCEQK